MYLRNLFPRQTKIYRFMNKLEIILESFSCGDASEKIFGYSNKRSKIKILNILLENGYSDLIFLDRNKNRIHPIIQKECIICKKEFKTQEGNREKEVCSIKCSNSLHPKRKENIKKVICSICKKEFIVNNRSNNKTCSKECRNNLISISKKNPIQESIEGKKGKLKRFECIICSKEFDIVTNRNNIKMCSKECRKEYFRSIQLKLVIDGIHKGWTSRNIESYPEKYFKGVLNNLGILFKFNYPISKKELGINELSYYFMDFFIEKDGRKIDLEIDGKQHNFKDRKKSDINRDLLLKSNDYDVYRIKWKNPINENNKEYIRKEIENLKTFLNL